MADQLTTTIATITIVRSVGGSTTTTAIISGENIARDRDAILRGIEQATAFVRSHDDGLERAP